jgi:hypothetical protein
VSVGDVVNPGTELYTLSTRRACAQASVSSEQRVMCTWVPGHVRRAWVPAREKIERLGAVADPVTRGPDFRHDSQYRRPAVVGLFAGRVL